MSAIEILGFVTGVVCVFLLVRENIWNWPIGIANNALYIAVFMKSGLYADAGLQVFYIAISLYGWYQWLHGGRGGGELQVSRTTLRGALGLAVAVLLGTVVLHQVLSRGTDSTVPGWDGLTTSMSLIAQFMMTRKLLENWWVWIAVDVIYIGLYIYKDLQLTALLYFLFLCLCIAGLRSWRRSLVQNAAAQ